MELQMTEHEICESFKTAKNRANQIGILAQLNDVPEPVIVEILTRNGVDGRTIPKRYQKSRKKKTSAAAVGDLDATSWQMLAEALGYMIQMLEEQKRQLDKQIAEANQKIEAASALITRLQKKSAADAQPATPERIKAQEGMNLSSSL